MPRGGKRPNSGRKSKAEEQRIRDILSPYRDETILKVVTIMRSAEKESDQLAAAKLLMSYDWGLPKQSVDVTSDNKPFILKLNGTKPEAK
jgi:hypothetical protein